MKDQFNMKSGDILLIDYLYDPVGWLIKFYTKGTVNHIAIALNENEILEASGDGIKVSSKSKFKNKFFKVKLLRLKHISKQKLYSVLDYLYEQRRQYKRREFYWDYINMLIGKKRKLKSCAWYVAEGLKKKANINICKRNFKFCTPEDFNHYSEVKDVTKEF